jgi:hypothetical protein
MNDEQKENIFNHIKDMETLSEVKRALRVNDIMGANAEEMIAKWEGRPITEPIYPAKKLTMENKAVEEAPVVKDVEPEPEINSEPEDPVAEEPEVEEDAPAPVAVSAPPSRFSR